MVAKFFDLCNKIWSESPATESMSSGAVNLTDAQSQSFESSTENTTL